MKENKTVYGSIVAELRTKRGWTQKELADQLVEIMPKDTKISPTLISAWETNSRPVAKKYTQPLCDIFHVSEEYLCGKTLLNNDNLQGMERVKYLETMRKEISYDQLNLYHKKPVYVAFDNMQYEAQWGIVDMGNKCIITIAHTIPLNAVNKKHMKVYEYQPYYTEGYLHLLAKKMDYKSMMDADKVYVMMTSMDDVVHAMYDGWYTHNLTKTALRNAEGNILPYAGLGKNFNCYPIQVGDIFRN